MNSLFSGAELRLSTGLSRVFDWPIREAIQCGDKTFVLLDPDAYLIDRKYKNDRRSGIPALRNLIAVDSDSGRTIWEGEMPESADYYYRFVSSTPLIVDSFSSFRCEIDAESGRISKREFFK